MKSNKHVISRSGNDNSIFLFKFKFNTEKKEEELFEIDDEEHLIDEDNANLYFKEEEIENGDEFAANKSWLGELQSSYPEVDQKNS